MKVFWTSAAEEDRAEIVEYIGQDNPRAAVALDESFGRAAGRLSRHPMLGRVGRIAGTREIFPHESYRMVYEIQGDSLWILALVHTSRMWPPKRS